MRWPTSPKRCLGARNIPIPAAPKESRHGEQHAYALLHADLAAASGTFIVPSWLQHQSALAIADITQDWSEALSGTYEEGVDGFITWLSQQTGPANVVDFFAERDKRREKNGDRPDGGQR